MLKSHQQFHSTNGKRRILIVDDEMTNRELLGACLEGEYELLYACDGQEALKIMKENSETLSLVLLDILMPVLSGIDVLKIIKGDMMLSQIPVIVLTADQEAEITCLKLGAMDFIPKPYPDTGVIHARILRTIELSEDREIIQSTERDPLTGLYNKVYFYQYAQQYDHYHKGVSMDAIIIDVNHFHMINERYGKTYGDQVLKTIGDNIRSMVIDQGGIVSRREADTFMIYCPHRDDYGMILEKTTVGLSGEDLSDNRVRLRMGIYSEVDKTIDIEGRFDRAKMAADMVRGSVTKTLSFYDDALHEKELYSEQLIEDFYRAIKENQFVVYFQPKYNVEKDQPVLVSAEALVRWIHPVLGMVSPGVFIPLFEENGLIQNLDRYVWREACRQIREWKDRLGTYVPVSVNVSRIDLYNPEIVHFLQDLVKEYDLTCKDLMLEITESAYTHDADQIIETAKQLREAGFLIEMDDFGTGYSSLNMVSSLPFDVMKLDMQFIKNAFRQGGDTRMIELIIDIAEYLSAPVIAEGIETKEQMEAMKLMGCQLIQGYYFSRPVPSVEFEKFFDDLRDSGSPVQEEKAFEMEAESDFVPEAFYREEGQEEGETEREEERESEAPKKKREGFALQLRTATYFFVLMAVIAAAALFAVDLSVNRGYQRMEQASDRYIAAQVAANDMESGSDFLTDRVRCFVVTGDLEYLEDYFEEVEITRRRDRAVEQLETHLQDTDKKSDALKNLTSALELSNKLMEKEYLAMRLKLEVENQDMSKIPEPIVSLDLSEKDQDLSPEEKNKKAQELVFNNEYIHYKERIREKVSQCTEAILKTSSQELEKASAGLSLIVMMQTIMTVVFLLIVLVIVLFIHELIRKPLIRMVELMKDQKTIPPMGAEELQFVSRTYNTILEENKTAHEKLKHEASHDALTGLFNRGAYDLMMQSIDTGHIALIIIDVDDFKTVNDTYGHAMGDRVLKRVAEILKHSFRSVDIICRLGGDEFVVIMTRVNSNVEQLLRNKIYQANELLLHPKDDLPPVSLSVGVAFSDRKNPQGDIFKDADTALYRVKKAGRNGCEIY